MYAYRFSAAGFTRAPLGGGWTNPSTVEPLSVEPVGDLLDRHESAGIELRVVSDLWALHVAVVGSTLQFSGVRLKLSPSYRPDELPAVRPAPSGD